MSDFEFAEKCLGGDSDAWRKFVEIYSPLVLSVIRKTSESFGAPFSSSDAEDLLGEIFLNLVKNESAGLRSYKGNSTLATWLRKVAANAIISNLRKKKAKSVPLECLPSLIEAADNSTKQKEIRVSVKLALDKLPDRERLAVMLFYFEHKKYREIAEILDIPANSVGPILSRALAVVRESMK